MKVENILAKANLKSPTDLVILGPDIIAKRLQEKAGIEKSELQQAMSKLFLLAINSAEFTEIIPRGLTDGTVNCLKILSTTRLVNSLSGAASIMEISKFTNLNRNFVSPCVKFLESFDLVSTKPHIRGQLVAPTELTTLYIDVISGNLEIEYKRLQTVANEAKQDKISSKSLQFLEDLETAFHFAKLAYSEATVNYEIMEELHDRIRVLVVNSKERKREEFMKDLKEFSDILAHIISVREKAREMGVHPAILEETKEKLGRARVFRVK